jgi:hypothetical protein
MLSINILNETILEYLAKPIAAATEQTAPLRNVVAINGSGSFDSSPPQIQYNTSRQQCFGAISASMFEAAIQQAVVGQPMPPKPFSACLSARSFSSLEVGLTQPFYPLTGLGFAAGWEAATVDAGISAALCNCADGRQQH